MTSISLDEIISLRKKLHRYAELSLKENETQKILQNFLEEKSPSGKIRSIAETGLMAVFDSGNPGLNIVFRADIDALPIDEIAIVDHASCKKGISHKCGHDGHAAILCALALMLQNEPPATGKVLLLFQPAEETGEGAANVLNDETFKGFEPDFIFALHNLPGFDINTILVKKEQFAAASKGMMIRLTGKSSHAAYPEQGVNPAIAFAEIIQQISDLPEFSERYDNFILTTIVHAKLGKPAFGSAAGDAEIFVTLRSYDNHNMQRLVQECSFIVEEKAKENGLKYSIKWADEFIETFNHHEAVGVIEKVCGENKVRLLHMPYPFRWSEDFGKFTAVYKGAMFGLGAGKTHAALHSTEYDFPDEIIETGMTVFYGIIKLLNR